MPGEHARFSLSASKAWLACDAWGPLTRDCPPSPDSPESIEGTRLHTVAEEHLRTWTNCDGADAAIVQPYLDHVRAVAAQHLDRELAVETRVNVDGLDCWGTLDAAVVDPLSPTLDVIDLKTGSGIAVDAQENPQLSLYAIGMLLRHAGKKPEAWADWRVGLHIVQPRRQDGKGAVDSWQTTGAALAVFYKQVKKQLKLQRAGTGKPAAGEHCRWCPAAATCPAQQAQVASVFPLEPDLAPVEPAQLTADRLAQAWRLSDAIRRWLDSVDAEILRRGGIPDVVKVVEGKSNRKWADEAAAIAAMQTAGLDPYKPREIIGIPAAEKLAGKQVIAPFVVRPPGKPTLAPAADPRPPFDPSSVFA